MAVHTEVSRNPGLFLSTADHSDVTYLVYPERLPDQRVIRAHKQFLTLKNEILAEFYKNNPTVTRVIESGVHPCGFYKVLEFFYTGRADFANVLEAAYTRTATRFFALPFLERMCSLYVHENLTSATVCPLLNYMFLMGESDVDGIAQFILRHEGLAVVSSTGFAVAGIQTVQAVLKYVANVPEAVVTQEVYKWLQNQRETSLEREECTVLNGTLKHDVLSKIRFLSLSAEEFVQGPGTWKLLDPQEKCAILSNIVEADSVPLPAWVSVNRTAREIFPRTQDRPNLMDSGGAEGQLEQEIRRMSKHTLGFLENGERSDVTFRLITDSFDVTRTMRAHRQYLALTNDVFEAMFFGEPREGAEVIIRDVHPDGFYKLVTYLYGAEPTFATVIEAAYTRTAARKYKVAVLETRCSQYIAKTLTAENVCSLLDYLFLVREVDLDDFLINIIRHDSCSILNSEAFTVASLKTVQAVLRYASHVPEAIVVGRAYQWIQEHLETNPALDATSNTPPGYMDVLRELRLLSLSPVEFVHGPNDWDIIEADDRYAIFSNIIVEASSSLPNWVNENRHQRK